jgi:hypothetical protein
MCGRVRQLDFDIVDVAPSPTFRRIVAFDDRMLCTMIMGAGMSVRRVVAATDMPACTAQTKVHPPRADL